MTKSTDIEIISDAVCRVCDRLIEAYRVSLKCPAMGYLMAQMAVFGYLQNIKLAGINK
jgi:hypothetical protein